MRHLAALILLASAPLLSQYTASVRMEYWSWQYNGNELEGILYADLYDGETLVEPDLENYSYDWYRNERDPQAWDYWRSGYSDRHGVSINHGYSVKVRITGPGFDVTSAPAYFGTPPSSSRHAVGLSSRLDDGSPAANSEILFWADPGWHVDKLVIVPDNYDVGQRYFTNDVVYAIRTNPDYRTTENQKFHRWLDNGSNAFWRNHQTVTMSTSVTEIKSHYKTPVDNSALSTVLLDLASSSTNFVQFKDPWVRNDTDLTHGSSIRNRGTDAIYESVPTGSNNLGLSTSRKGLFLNQDPNQTSVFYRVRAAETPTVNGQLWVFWRWDTSGVILTSPSNLVSGYYESPVIFRNWGTRTVTATYKAHLASNGSDA